VVEEVEEIASVRLSLQIEASRQPLPVAEQLEVDNLGEKLHEVVEEISVHI